MMANRVDELISYVMTVDSGFAPNPYFGLCTLACCKPKLRAGVGNRVMKAAGCDDVRRVPADVVRDMHIWVVGLAGRALTRYAYRGVVYAMQVMQVMDFATYFQKHPEKRPCQTGGVGPDDPCWHGDAIYTTNSPRTAVQLRSEHSYGDRENPATKMHDLGGRYVLLSDHFVHFGQRAPLTGLEARLDEGVGFSISRDTGLLRAFEGLLDGEWSDELSVAGKVIRSEVVSGGGRCRG
ncbi:MAG: hypothetical protein FWF75_02125 [Propionibacteriaceae bacterium]|nr:hypothetical protein [Propionibacteriaceae bacterium]